MGRPVLVSTTLDGPGAAVAVSFNAETQRHREGRLLRPSAAGVGRRSSHALREAHKKLLWELCEHSVFSVLK